MSASPTLSGFCKTIGLRLLRTDKECVIGEVDATHQYFTARGRVHGGLLMSFGDSLGAIGTALNMPETHATSTIESKTNFFHAPKHGRLQGAAIPLHVGRTTQVWRTDITDLTGRTVATVTQTQLVIAN
ncbi:MAG: PaaI family thioesterase [Casimicrobiaceae bacterium]